MVHRQLFKNRAVCACASMIAMFVISVAAHGEGVLYVDDDAPQGGDGTTWGTAYRFLQDALADASGGGVTEVRVGQGTYKPDRDEANPSGTGDREVAFQLLDGVALMGSYAGIGADDPDVRDFELYETILSGDLAGDDGPGFEGNLENSHNVVRVANLRVGAIVSLDGFIIKGGNAADAPSPIWSGGAVYILFSDFVSQFSLANCTFIDNVAKQGGAVFAYRGVGEIADCAFVHNAATEPGGALHLLNGTACLWSTRFEMNEAFEQGGGVAVSSPSGDTCVIDCHFLYNTAHWDGGGLFVDFSGGNRLLSVSGCSFIGNAAILGQVGADGGGLFSDDVRVELSDTLFLENFSAVHAGGAMIDSDVESLIVNCTFLGNTAGYDGGGLQLLGGSPKTIVNSLFLGNVAFRDGGGIFNPVSGGGDAGRRFANCTVAGNTAGGVGGGILAGDTDNVIENCVVWGNSDINGQGQESQVTFSNWPFPVNYSCIQGWNGTYDGVGSHGNDPLFIDPDNGDYRLSSGSPCIDAADNSAVPKGIDTDLDGNLRFVDDPDTKDTGFGDPPIVDMGAYEFQVVSSCPWDLDDDGDVGVKDLLILLGAWGPCKGCPADFDDSGDVGVKDLLILLGNWGPCP
ncbi:MAG: hypothetical protein IIB53_02675 [Planctomycetes bacterium]|nr:hypothetical protein [Planctomycetota bacterium]